MGFKIVADSCADLTKEELKKEYYESVPLVLILDGEDIYDDETIDQKSFLEKLKNCSDVPRSACPSPERFIEAFGGEEEVYIVTLSSKLSGSYNAAVLSMNIYLEDHPDAKIHVFDSKSAAAAEHLITEFIEKLKLEGKEFDEVVSLTEKYIASMNTVFVLETLEVFVKNGRVPKLKGMAAAVLNIKPVLIGVDGEIEEHEKCRGMNKALNGLVRFVEKQNPDRNRPVRITACDSVERCMNVRKILVEKLGFKDVKILNAGGLSSLYENAGGVVLSF